MTTEAVLTLTQWLSPAYPVGAFAWSHGLEALVQEGAVRDATSLRDWLETVLRHGAGWNDALFLAAAYRVDDPAEVDATARAFAASAERLAETLGQGAAFARVTGAVWGGPSAPSCYPVAVGAAARAQDLPIDLTARMFLQAVMSNLVGAGMRLIPLGQTEGQRLIRDLTPMCSEIAGAALDATLDDLTSTAFLADIAAMRHETLYSRIFRS